MATEMTFEQNNEQVKRIRFFFNGVILAGSSMLALFLVQLSIWTFGSTFIDVRNMYGYPAAHYIPHLLLTIAFGLCLTYSVIGAIIAGSIPRDDMHPCFMCLFSMAVPVAMIGLGTTWMNYLENAVWLMIGTIFFLVTTSFFAKKPRNETSINA